MRLAARALVISIALIPACGRTELGDLLLHDEAVADDGGSAQGGSARNAAVAGSSNAGQSGASGVGGMVSVECGDGIVGPGEACDPGSDPAAPAFELRQGSTRVRVAPIVGPMSAVEHYAYYSRSSHTGFEVAGKSSLYLYRSSGETAAALVILNGIDEDTTGIVQPPSDIVLEFQGLPDTAVVFSDDDAEFAKTTPSTAYAAWDCNRNSDGGMIEGLSTPLAWHLTITASFFAGISDWSFLTGGEGSDPEIGAEIPLDLSLPIEIVASDEISACREGCTVPRCGDAILDAGEVCDDGNDQPGDACFDCRPEP